MQSRRVFGFNLGLRLYLLLVAIIGPTLFVYYVYNFNTIEKLHDEEVEEAARTVAYRLRAFLENGSPHALEDEEARARYVEGLNREVKTIVNEARGIENAAVFIDSGSGLSHVTGYGVDAPIAPSSLDLTALVEGRAQTTVVILGGKRYRAIAAPIPDIGGAQAVVHFLVLPEGIGLGQRLPELRANLLIGGGAMLLITGLGVALFFQLAVRRPIVELTGAMAQATEGNLTVMVGPRSGEFGWLAVSYNHMIRQLKATIEENERLLGQIRSFNKQLGDRVSAATVELASKNRQLEVVNERLFEMQRRTATQEKLATLGQVAAIIAHELGTPLNAISGHLQLLIQEPITEGSVLDRLRAIDRQVDRLAAIVADVLKVMRVPPPRLDRVDVNAVARETAELIMPVAQKRGIRLALRAGPDVPSITADAGQLQQVLLNLLTNATDAMDKGGEITIATAFVGADEVNRLVEQDASLTAGQGHVRIDVEDTGRGLDPSAIRQIFEPFHTTKRDGGPGQIRLGLGLAICRQIVRYHHGDITVRSEPGRGARFTIFLPVEQPRFAVVG